MSLVVLGEFSNTYTMCYIVVGAFGHQPFFIFRANYSGDNNMSYKYSKGAQVIGDLQAADDAERNTQIDFEEDYIGFETSGSAVMVVSGSKVGIGTTTPDYTLDVAGDMGVNQYIYHNGDGNTWINFTDNRIRLNAGGNNFIDCEDPGSSPHKVRINNGGNNIDFVIKDNSNNVYFTADASTSRVGIGTTSPATSLHIDGSYAGKASVISSYPHSVSSTDYIILATGTASPVRKVTLPAISGQQGRIIIVKDASGNAGSNGLEVDADGSETIDGSLDKLINSNYGFLVLVCGASEWHVIGQ